METFFWSAKQPCPCPDKKCVIMNKYMQGLYYWMPANCSVKHNYLCMVEGNSLEFKLKTLLHYNEAVTSKRVHT